MAQAQYKISTDDFKVRHLSIGEDKQRVINIMLSRFSSIMPFFKYRFDSEDEFNDFVREWTLGLIEEGVCNEFYIQNGLRVMRKKTKFPQSIAEFVSWCRSFDAEELGVPSEKELLLRYRRFLAVQNTNYHFEFKNDLEYWILISVYRAEYYCRHSTPLTESELLKAIKSERQQWIEKLSQGETVPPRVNLIEKNTTYSKVHCSPEQWQSRINLMRTKLQQC